MKNFLFFTALLFISWSHAQNTSETEVNYIYDATYLDSFEIGNPDLVLKVQEMHKHLINKDYEKAGSYMADNIVFRLEDGSTLEGKENCMKFMIDAYSSIEIKDYQVGVNFAVKGDNGHEWVLLWDSASIVSKTGESSAYSWMEAFRFEGGKIVTVNQYSKPVK